ncbi:MAG: DUF5069 domain-containing protein [Verrucomicrobiota bacterium]
MIWNDYFLALFDSCCATYRSGVRDLEKFYSGEDIAFLTTIGCQTREFFDFVEDCCEEGVPGASTALLVAAVRRDYFLTVQHGITSHKTLTRDELPSFGHELEGMAYLPRILTKARAKLCGELDPDMMFGCGGDRNFLRKHGSIHPADFLRHVWAAGADDAKLAAWVKSQAL